MCISYNVFPIVPLINTYSSGIVSIDRIPYPLCFASQCLLLQATSLARRVLNYVAPEATRHRVTLQIISRRHKSLSFVLHSSSRRVVSPLYKIRTRQQHLSPVARSQ